MKKNDFLLTFHSTYALFSFVDFKQEKGLNLP